MGGERTALLIIRAWIEEGSPEPLRAHIRISDNVSVGFHRTLTLSRPEAVFAEVERWLADVMNRQPTTGDAGSP